LIQKEQNSFQCQKLYTFPVTTFGRHG